MLWQTRIPGQLMKRQQPGNVHLQTICRVRGLMLTLVTNRQAVEEQEEAHAKIWG